MQNRELSCPIVADIRHAKSPGSACGFGGVNAIAKARRDLAPLLRTYRGDENPKAWKSQRTKLLEANRNRSLTQHSENETDRLLREIAIRQALKPLLSRGRSGFLRERAHGTQAAHTMVNPRSFSDPAGPNGDIYGTLEEKLLAA